MRYRSLFVAGLLVVALSLMGRALLDNLQNFGDLSEADVLRILAALSLMMISTLILAANWLIILRFLGSPVRTAGTLKFFLTTWPFRYIPGTFPYHAARVMMADRFGAKGGPVAASIAYESILMIGSAALVGAVGLLLTLGSELSGDWLYLVAGVPLAALPVAVHPRILVPVANKLLTITRRPTLSSGDVLSMSQTGLLFLAYTSVQFLTGASFWLVAPTITGSPLDPVLAVSAFSMASAIGVAVIFVPGGIGIREGAIVVLLSSALASDEALLLGGAVRAISVVADLIPPALIAGFGLGEWLRRLLRARRVPVGASSHSGQSPVE